MADFPIIPRAYHFAKGAKARLDGKSADSHNLNWHAAALAQWQSGYYAAARTHSDIVASERVDARQGARNA